MRRLLLLILCIFQVSTTLPEKARQSQVLLEVRTSSFGMGPTGDHLYLRLYDSGKVEYEDENLEEGRSGYVLKSRQISSARLKAMIEFLNDEGIKNLKAKYPPAYPNIDYSVQMDLKIVRGDTSQVIETMNYDSVIGKTKGIYPPSLIELICRIEGLRANASFRVTNVGGCIGIALLSNNGMRQTRNMRASHL